MEFPISNFVRGQPDIGSMSGKEKPQNDPIRIVGLVAFQRKSGILD